VVARWNHLYGRDLQGCRQDDRGDTLMTLRHGNLPDDEIGHRHRASWGFVLSIIEERFSARDA